MTSFVVERDKIIHNIRIVKERAGGRIVYAVVKDNAYGLGLDGMVRTLLQEGIDHFAVTAPGDALRIRAVDADAGVLLLNPVRSAQELAALVAAGVTLSISSLDYAAFVNDVCGHAGAVAAAHVEIDTGMGRFGLDSREYGQILSVYREFSGLRVTGLFTHLYHAQSRRNTERQLARFGAVLGCLSANQIAPGVVHAASSVALFRYPQALFDAVRVGSAFTGRLVTREKYGLEKVGYIESDVCEIRRMPKGHNVGYGGVCKTKAATTVAVIPVGYLHGFCLERTRDVFRLRDALRSVCAALRGFLLHKKVRVTINGASVPVVGRVGASHIVADVGAIECRVGDRVVLEASPLFCGNILPVVYK